MPIKQDRATNIESDQLKNGCVGVSELNTKQTKVDIECPPEGHILVKEEATVSGQDHEMTWKDPCLVMPVDGGIFK
jgi:hypothetical protein